MKKTILTLLGVIIVVGLGWSIYSSGSDQEGGNTSSPKDQNQSSEEKYTLKDSRKIAKDWMGGKCPTYTYDGEDLSLKESRELDAVDCEDCYEFDFAFKSMHGGFGDREGKMVTQAITPHLTTVTVEHGEITQAITDNEFNELTEEVKQGGQGVDRLQPQTVKLFYYNKEEDKNSEGEIMCHRESVQPVERIIPAQEPIKETIDLLLEGDIRPEEKQQSFQTEFPNPEFQLKEMDLNENTGKLTLTFTEVPGFTSGGSCRMGLLKAQIEKTAKQFPDVQEVVIEPESLFQP